MSVLVFLGVTVTIIFVIAFALYLANQKKDAEEPENKPILINRMPHLSGGHVFGVINKIEIGNERTMIEMLPRDINVQKELNQDKNFTIKPYTLYFENDQLKTYANWSSHVKIYVGNPSDPSQLPEEMKRQEPEIIKQIQNDNDEKHHNGT